MPTYQDKSGNSKFSMNPQVGKSLIGGQSAPGMDAVDDNGASDETGDHVELHHGGHPEGQPPPHEGTKYHTIHTQATGADIRNHEDYQGADQHMQECMGESGGMEGMDDMSGDMGSSGDDGGTE